MVCQKHLFSLEEGVHFINGAYMSPQLKSVEAAGIQGLIRKARPYEIPPEHFFTESEQLRALFAQLIHAPSAQHVSFMPAVSYGTAIVAHNLSLQRGQKIIVTDAQFPSNVYPWLDLAAKKGIDVQIIPMPESGNRGKQWNEALLEAIDNRTVLVAIEHAHWANGVLFDLKSIGEKVHQHGGLLLVDGTQSVGVLPMDVRALGIDILVCGGYKWLLGPYSLGYAYFHEKLHHWQPIEENWINRRYSENFAGLTNYQMEYQPGALRFDVGEHSNFALVPMGMAAIKQLLDWGAANIQAYCHQLTADAVTHWQSLGFGVEPADQRAAHLFGLSLPPHIDIGSLQEKLRQRRIFVSVRGGFVRISPNVYNDEADIQALTEVMMN
jgi:selenocysteine lyase/cysteine desulfurase